MLYQTENFVPAGATYFADGTIRPRRINATLCAARRLLRNPARPSPRNAARGRVRQTLAHGAATRRKHGMDPIVERDTMGDLRVAMTAPPTLRNLSEAVSHEPLRDCEATTVDRVATYAVNATVLTLSAPVGAALFTLNALGGENLRTNAHSLALTGLGMVLINLGLVGI